MTILHVMNAIPGRRVTNMYSYWHIFYFRIHKTKRSEFKCPHCPHVTHRKPLLQRHIDAVHTMLRKYPCPEFGCHQIFKRPASLKQHSFLHLNIKPFRCKWCDFSGNFICFSFHFQSSLAMMRRLIF